jgi:hypothetical protein
MSGPAGTAKPRRARSAELRRDSAEATGAVRGKAPDR